MDVIKGRGPRIILWLGQNGLYYFHKRNANGRVTEPSQGYKHKRSAIHAARRDIPGLPIQYAKVRRIK